MIISKAGAPSGEGLEFVLSDATPDRMGDVVEQNGWDLRPFKRNPVALFNHNSNFPLGVWENVRVEGGRLMGRLKLAARGTSARIDELISLVDQGILRAVSIGAKVLDSDPIDPKRPYGATRYKRLELLEVSLVSVPANPAALAVARSLNLSGEVLSLAFGAHADETARDRPAPGGNAASTSDDRRRTAGHPTLSPGDAKMATLSQRIQATEADLLAKRDRLSELTAADALDVDAVADLNDQVSDLERTLDVLKQSEKRIGTNATPAGGGVAAPHVQRRPLGLVRREVGGFDLLVRAATVHALAHATGRTLERVLDAAYPGHEATALLTKADQTIGTTTGSHWADDLMQTVNQGFLQALTGFSIYPALRSRGIGLSVDGANTVNLPRRTGGTAGGGWVAEGSPIRVGKLTTAAASLTPKKMGVIVAYSDELAERSVPAVEALVRRAILEDTAATLDSALLDATASSTARPAGLLYGVSAVASGVGGGDHEAVKEDFKALLQPFIDANAADGITVIMNPAQDLSIAMMDGPANNANWFNEIRGRVNFVVSTYATAGRIIALRNSDFATAMGDTPRFDVSQQATIHMEDTTPLEIVSGTGPTTADPVRSLWQTASTAIRMILPVSWTMARPNMVQWINGTSY